MLVWLRMEDTEFAHGKPLYPGFPLEELTTDHCGSAPAVSKLTEVVALSTDRLDPSVFRIPYGYQKVDHLSQYPAMDFTQEVAFDWMQFVQAVKSWFD